MSDFRAEMLLCKTPGQDLTNFQVTHPAKGLCTSVWACHVTLPGLSSHQWVHTPLLTPPPWHNPITASVCVAGARSDTCATAVRGSSRQSTRPDLLCSASSAHTNYLSLPCSTRTHCMWREAVGGGGGGRFQLSHLDCWAYHCITECPKKREQDETQDTGHSWGERHMMRCTVPQEKAKQS